MTDKRFLVMFLAALTAIHAGCDKSPQPSQIKAPVVEVPPNVLSETDVRIESWKARLIQRHYGAEASDNRWLDVELVEESGSRRILAEKILGPLMLFEDEKRIFSCETNGILAPPGPLSLDLNGKKTPLPLHDGSLRQCNRIPDSQLVYLLYDAGKDALEPTKWSGVVRVIDAFGNVLLDKRFYQAAKFKIPHQGKTYNIEAPDPGPPG